MGRPRKSLIEQFLAVYREMPTDERERAKAALVGFDAAVAPRKHTEEDANDEPIAG